MGTHKGGIQYSLSTIIVLVLILFFALGSAGFIPQLIDVLKRGFVQMDHMKIEKSAEQLQGEGSALARLELKNNYSFDRGTASAIEMGDGADGFDSGGDPQGFLQTTVDIQLPKKYSIVVPGGAIDGTTAICLWKNGMEYQITEPPCETDDIGPAGTDLCDTGRCSAFTPADHPDASPDRIDIPEKTPIEGYYCKNGVFTNEDFYKHYWTSDGAGCAPDDARDNTEIANITRVACPNMVFKGQRFHCTVRAVWKCDEGNDVTVEIFVNTSTEGGTSSSSVFDSQTYDCNGEVQYRRVPLSLLVRREYTGWTASPIGVETTLTTPNKEASRYQANGMRMEPGGGGP